MRLIDDSSECNFLDYGAPERPTFWRLNIGNATSKK